MKENPAFLSSGRKVYAYDLFTWFDWMNESLAGTGLSGRFAEGDSFLEEFKKRTSEYSDHIEVRAGDLATIGWERKPVEFLLVDAMKNWDLANAIVRDFYPHLIPGKSLVLHQNLPTTSFHGYTSFNGDCAIISRSSRTSQNRIAWSSN